jgi:hypothetical protein
MSALVTLPMVIAHVESGSNPHAVRFEPATYAGKMILDAASMAILNRITEIHDCSHETAKVLYSTSFGFFQIMGFDLYGELGYDQTVFTYCDDQEAQYALFAKFVQAHNINYGVSELAAHRLARTKFGTVYNGDGEAYANEIESALFYFKVPVARDANGEAIA